jgi:hypothetical protein
MHGKRQPCRRCGGPKEPGERRHYCDACKPLAAEERRQAKNAGNLAWYYANRETIAEKWRLRQEDPDFARAAYERVKAWAEANPERWADHRRKHVTSYRAKQRDNFVCATRASATSRSRSTLTGENAFQGSRCAGRSRWRVQRGQVQPRKWKQTAKGTPATVASSVVQAGRRQHRRQRQHRQRELLGRHEVRGVLAGPRQHPGQGQPVLQSSVDDLAWWLWIFHGAETVTPSGTNAVQTVTTTGTPTGGTFTLTFEGRTTATIAFNATAAVVQAALEALPNIGTGNVLGGGGPLPTGVTLTFQNALAKRPIAPLTANSAGLTGGTSPTVDDRADDPGRARVHTFTPSTTSAGSGSRGGRRSA